MLVKEGGKQVNITIFKYETIVCLRIERSPFDEDLFKYFRDHLQFFHKKEIESCDYLPSQNNIFIIGTHFLYTEIEKFLMEKQKLFIVKDVIKINYFRIYPVY